MNASFQFHLFDSQGKHLFNQELRIEKNQINLPTSITPGFYYFTIQNENRKIVQRGKLAKL